MGKTKIEWATHTWNPATGCTKVSEGCRNCYAERVVQRFGAKVHGYSPDGSVAPFSEVKCRLGRLKNPIHWRKPRRIFVCSMGDLFHEDVPEEFIGDVLWVMERAPQHQYMVLTKRPERMKAALNDIREGQLRLDNLWLGVSVEDQATADERIPLLLQTPAAVRFVSCEPMLGPVDLTCVGGPPVGNNYDGADGINAFKYRAPNTKKKAGIDWVICGGESGPGARPMHPDWATSLRDQCVSAGVPFWFKQWGEWLPTGQEAADEEKARAGILRSCPAGSMVDGTCEPYSWLRAGKKAAGNLLDGKKWEQLPGKM